MSRPDGVSQWTATVSNQMPHLSRPQARVLALWSYGMVMTQSCGLTTVATFLALLLGKRPGALRQQLREWCYAACDKKGSQRQEVAVRACFVALLRWVLAWWPAEERRVVLALDATTLGQRFTVLALSVVYRGCAIPVAWVVVPATQKGAWRPHWEGLFALLQERVPADWTVLVLADRGLYARWLYRRIVHLGWHPFLRINQGGQFRPQGAAPFRPLASVAPRVGTGWCGTVDCFVTPECRLTCTLLARWEDGYAEPWLVLTDLSPTVADVAWYSMRSWIECGFKTTKRGGWHWQQTKMTDPERASRLWLAIAVATLWVVSVGGEAEASRPASSLAELPVLHVAHRLRSHRRTRPRLLTILATLIAGRPLPLGRFIPEPWPSGATRWVTTPVALSQDAA
jgi:hypothetical protein